MISVFLNFLTVSQSVCEPPCSLDCNLQFVIEFFAVLLRLYNNYLRFMQDWIYDKVTLLDENVTLTLYT